MSTADARGVALTTGASTRTAAAPSGIASPPRHGVTGAIARFAGRVSAVWVPRLGWSIARTGRSGLTGLALLGATGVFFVSTHLPVLDEVNRLQSDLATARGQATHPAAVTASDPVASLRNLPARTDMPQVLRTLLQQADEAQLAIDTAKYEISASKAGGFVRYRISFPVDGPYPNVRRFIDGSLKNLPSLAIDELAISRKSIADGSVEAQIRMTLFTRGAP